MAIDGKRTIFTDQKIPYAIGGNTTATAAVRPGALVEQSASGIAESARAATVFNRQILFADYDRLSAGSVDDVIPVGDQVIARKLPADCSANVLVAAGQNITAPGLALSSNGDGTLKLAAATSLEKIVAYSDEIINTGASAALVKVKGA
jgi:hypothetical protein